MHKNVETKKNILRHKDVANTSFSSRGDRFKSAAPLSKYWLLLLGSSDLLNRVTFEYSSHTKHLCSAHRDDPLWFAVTSLSASSKDWGNGDPIRRVLAFSDELLRFSVTSDVQFLQASVLGNSDPLALH